MSTHATVEIWENGGAPKSEERPVVLFKYCDGDMLINDVIEAMKRGKSRWNDPAYLSRIIFCQMLCGDLEPLTGTTGYGILTDNISDAKVEIVIDCCRQEVIVKEIKRDNERYTFKEFANLCIPSFVDSRTGDRRRKNTNRRKMQVSPSMISSIGYRGEE